MFIIFLNIFYSEILRIVLNINKNVKYIVYFLLIVWVNLWSCANVEYVFE